MSASSAARTSLAELRVKLTEIYPFGGGPKRFQIPDASKISWDEPWPSYSPPYFTAKKVLENKSWADPEEFLDKIKFNSIDGKINRNSHTGIYKLDDRGFPLNPAGRTGMGGRGILGKWGPNHAADPIVTRWKQVCTPSDSPGLAEIVNQNQKPRILQFIGIQRKDTGEWAIPGGMVDPGEESSATLKREFFEEVFSIDDSTKEDAMTLESSLSQLFQNGMDIYKGYVDDPRNTDNAWMETHAVNFHADEGIEKILSQFPLKAGSDAKNAEWIDISSSLALYASHSKFIQRVAELRGGFW